MSKSRTAISWRVRRAAAFANLTPNLPAGDWNVTNGLGWSDAPSDPDGAPLSFGVTNIFPAVACGNRALNTADPVQGLYTTDLGSMALPYYPELMHPWWDITMGVTNKTTTPTAGTAAKASGLLTALADLDTQPSTTEQLVFTVDSATDITGVVIDIIQNGEVVEQVTLPDSTGGAGNHAYYSKGGYDGTSQAITFSVTGTAALANVVVSGVQYHTTTWKMSQTAPNGEIEQIGRVEVDDTDSQFATGVVVPTMGLNYDRTAADGLLMFEPAINGNYGGAHAKGACSGDAAKFYKPVAAWNAVVKVDAVQNFEVQTFAMAPNTQDELTQVSTGNQGPHSKAEGYFDVTAAITLVPADKTRFDNYMATNPESWKIIFSTPHLVADLQPYTVTIDMGRAFYEVYTPANSSMVHSADVTLRMVSNDNDGGPFAITHIDRRGI